VTPNTAIEGRLHRKKTPERLQTIRNILSLGLNFKTAASAAGITTQCLAVWRNEDPKLDAELKALKAQFIGTITGKAVAAALKGEPWAIKLILQARSEEFKPKIAERVTSSDSVEDQAAEMYGILQSMDANILDNAVSAPKDGKSSNGTNGASGANGITVEVNDNPH